MAEMAEKEYKVYLKEVNWWRTTVTAACEEDAKVKAKEEHNTFEDYEDHGSSLTFLTEMEAPDEVDAVWVSAIYNILFQYLKFFS